MSEWIITEDELYPIYTIEEVSGKPNYLKDEPRFDLDQAFLDRLDKAWEEWNKCQAELEKIVEQQQE